MTSISTKMNVSHKAEANHSLRKLTLENKQLDVVSSKLVGSNRHIVIKNCVIEEVTLREIEVSKIEIINCQIKKLDLESLKGIRDILVRNSKVDHFSILRNFGFQRIALDGLIIKGCKILQNNGCNNSSISVDLESKKLNKLDVMYNYATHFDLLVPGKMRSLHLRRNNFENIEFKNSASPHTSVKVKSA